MTRLGRKARSGSQLLKAPVVKSVRGSRRAIGCGGNLPKGQATPQVHDDHLTFVGRQSLKPFGNLLSIKLRFRFGIDEPARP